ncbi:hypothetical protein ACVWYQ_003515 [Bradyrhizobium sp. USDA 3397]
MRLHDRANVKKRLTALEAMIAQAGAERGLARCVGRGQYREGSRAYSGRRLVHSRSGSGLGSGVAWKPGRGRAARRAALRTRPPTRHLVRRRPCQGDDFEFLIYDAGSNVLVECFDGVSQRALWDRKSLSRRWHRNQDAGDAPCVVRSPLAICIVRVSPAVCRSMKEPISALGAATLRQAPANSSYR